MLTGARERTCHFLCHRKEGDRVIRFEHVSKRFSDGKRTVEAVKDVSLEIEKGSIAGIIGFSGAGKGTVLSQVLARRPDLYFSVSFTTRPPREGEKDGVNYHFVTRQAFQERIERGEFLEYAE